MKASDDPRVLHRYLERPNRRRFERLVRTYQQFVYTTALRVTRNSQDAQDIAQDVFLKLLLEPPAPETVKSPAAFLAWRVVGRATNLRRAAERRRDLEARGRQVQLIMCKFLAIAHEQDFLMLNHEEHAVPCIA